METRGACGDVDRNCQPRAQGIEPLSVVVGFDPPRPRRSDHDGTLGRERKERRHAAFWEVTVVDDQEVGFEPC